MREKIVLIRHGESLANVDSRYYMYPEEMNILSEKGAKQALLLSKPLKNIITSLRNPTVISSMYIRAKLTASIALHDHPHINVLADGRLNECEFNVNGKREPSMSVKTRVKGVVDEHPGSLILFVHGELMRHLDQQNTRDPQNCEFRIYDRNSFIENHLMIDHQLIIVP